MTLKFLFILLYAALSEGANPVLSGTVDLSKISYLRTGDMKKLVIYSEAKDMPDMGFLDAQGNETSMDVYLGKTVLLNFWATWCAPCLSEMPAIDALQAELGGDDFVVVTIATGRNSLPAIKKFFAKAQIENLPILLDPQGRFLRANGVFGLPTTLILNAEGKVIARMQGDTDWHSKEALIVLKALLPKADES